MAGGLAQSSDWNVGQVREAAGKTKIAMSEQSRHPDGTRALTDHKLANNKNNKADGSSSEHTERLLAAREADSSRANVF